MSALADEIREAAKKYSRLSDKSQKIVEEMIDAIYRIEKENDELKGESFKIEVIPIEE